MLGDVVLIVRAGHIPTKRIYVARVQSLVCLNGRGKRLAARRDLQWIGARACVACPCAPQPYFLPASLARPGIVPRGTHRRGQSWNHPRVSAEACAGTPGSSLGLTAPRFDRALASVGPTLDRVRHHWPIVPHIWPDAVDFVRRWRPMRGKCSQHAPRLATSRFCCRRATGPPRPPRRSLAGAVVPTLRSMRVRRRTEFRDRIIVACVVGGWFDLHSPQLCCSQ